MADDLDPGTLSNELRAAVGGAIGGFVIAVVCALLLAFTDLSVLNGIFIGSGFFLIWGTQAVRLLRRRRRGRG